MSAPPVRSFVQRHPSVRWLVPAGVLGAVIVAATGMLTAGASIDDLPSASAADLIADLQSPTASGFSGTVVSRVSLGLPELPSLAGASDAAPLTSLLSGTHTLQVWYGGADKQRIALLGATDETDVFRNGRDLWHWDSADRVAVHTVLPKLLPRTGSGSDAKASVPTDVASTATPDDLARRVLAAIDPTTSVRVEHNHQVADRSAYELVLTPRADPASTTASTRIGSVHLAVDGNTKIPLGVQIYARGARGIESSPAIDVSYTSVHFVQPSDTYFRFSPPAGATVHTATAGSGLSRVFSRLADPLSGSRADSGSAGTSGGSGAAHRVSVSGTGWSAVAEVRTGQRLSADGPLAQALTPVSGSWGKGWLLDSSLLCVLVVRDGRVYAGAVEPGALYAAAATK